MSVSTSPRMLTFACLLSLCTWQAEAARPTWIPIAELLIGSIGEADPARMSQVMSRCTALNMTLSVLADEYSEEMSASYQSEALRMIQHGILIESNLEQQRTGIEADIPTLSDAAMVQVKAMVDGYSLWLDDNISAGNSYFSKEFDLEIDGCRLASRMMNQISE